MILMEKMLYFILITKVFYDFNNRQPTFAASGVGKGVPLQQVLMQAAED